MRLVMNFCKLRRAKMKENKRMTQKTPTVRMSKSMASNQTKSSVPQRVATKKRSTSQETPKVPTKKSYQIRTEK